jgi:hypothetical protein
VRGELKLTMEESPTEKPFAGVRGRNTADYLMRTAQQHHVQISVMADTKANILITVCSIILTIAISNLGKTEVRQALLALSAFTLLSLVLAVVAILPKFFKIRMEGRELPANFNLIFFGHFTSIPQEQFLREIGKTLETDENVYEVLAKDLYLMGSYLDRWKYRFLRWAYVALLTGFVASAVVGFLVVMS